MLTQDRAEPSRAEPQQGQGSSLGGRADPVGCPSSRSDTGELPVVDCLTPQVGGRVLVEPAHDGSGAPGGVPGGVPGGDCQVSQQPGLRRSGRARKLLVPYQAGSGGLEDRGPGSAVS